MFYSEAAFSEGFLGVDAEIVQKGSGEVKNFNITKNGREAVWESSFPLLDSYP